MCSWRCRLYMRWPHNHIVIGGINRRCLWALPVVSTAADRAPHRPQDPQDGADDQQDDPERHQDPDVGDRRRLVDLGVDGAPGRRPPTLLVAPQTPPIDSPDDDVVRPSHISGNPTSTRGPISLVADPDCPTCERGGLGYRPVGVGICPRVEPRPGCQGSWATAPAVLGSGGHGRFAVLAGAALARGAVRPGDGPGLAPTLL